jgi:drug/metabolite transporter (DMT)-like permease
MTVARAANDPAGTVSGPVYLLASTVLLAGTSSVAKVIGDHYPITEILWARHVIPLGMAVLVFAPAMGTRLLRTRSLRLQLLRSSALLAGTLFFFLALQYLPLAETAAIMFASPIITVVLAYPMLGERVSRLSAGAAVVGFVGVVAVIQPFSGQFGLAALLPLGAALASSLYSILTRALGGRDSAATTWFYTSLVGVVATSIGAPFGWVVPAGPIDLLLLLLLGVLGGAGHFLAIKAYQRTAASVLAPLTYLELAWLTLIGSIVFHELPNLVGLAGIALITVSGTIVAIPPRTIEPGPPKAPFPPPP